MQQLEYPQLAPECHVSPRETKRIPMFYFILALGYFSYFENFDEMVDVCFQLE